MRGLVTEFSVRRGFGFIAPENGAPRVFFGRNALRASGLQAVPAFSTVEYEVEMFKGKPSVMKVTVLEGETGTNEKLQAG